MHLRSFGVRFKDWDSAILLIAGVEPRMHNKPRNTCQEAAHGLNGYPGGINSVLTNITSTKREGYDSCQDKSKVEDFVENRIESGKSRKVHWLLNAEKVRDRIRKDQSLQGSQPGLER